MKEVFILKNCRYLPAGQVDKPENRIPVQARRIVQVDDKQADKMVEGNVGTIIVKKKPEEKKPEPKKAPVNKQKKVSETRADAV